MDRLNGWMMLIANVGVIAGIIFLAYEIRVNTDAIRAESAAGYAQNVSGALVTDLETQRVRRTIELEGWDAVTDEERWVARTVATKQFKQAEYAYIQWIEGNLDDRLWEGNERGLYAFLWSSNLMRDSWASGTRNNFSTEFQAHVDAMIADVCARRECAPLPGFDLAPTPELVEAIDGWIAHRSPAR